MRKSGKDLEQGNSGISVRLTLYSTLPKVFWVMAASSLVCFSFNWPFLGVSGDSTGSDMAVMANEPVLPMVSKLSWSLRLAGCSLSEPAHFMSVG